MIVGAVFCFLIGLAVSGPITLAVLVIALFPALAAYNKNEDFLKWYCYGVMIWLVAMPHSLLIPQRIVTK